MQTWPLEQSAPVLGLPVSVSITIVVEEHEDVHCSECGSCSAGPVTIVSGPREQVVVVGELERGSNSRGTVLSLLDVERTW